MSNISKLATYTNITTKCNPRTERVLFLIPHCIVGQWTAKQAADYFCSTDRSCSVNYGVGKDGSISCNVDEDHRAWTTSSSWVDQRGITMEIASDTTAPYAMTDAAINAWLDLAEDICKRYGRTKVLWFGNKEDTNNHQYADNEIAIQVHRWWDNKSCPGDYFYNKIPSLVAELNKRLNKNAEYTNKDEFVAVIAKYVQKIAPEFDIKVNSPVIAQAILESGWGTSNKAKHNNFFGLKYREGRLTCHSGTFVDGSSEQLPDGTYVPITDQWFEFKTIEDGVRGYFQYTNIDRYKNLKGVTDPHEYLVNIKADGYATSLAYVDNVYNVIVKNNLTKYDNVTEEDDDMFYRVQCGAYKEKKNAEAQVAKLKSLGIDCFIVEVDGDIEDTAKPAAPKKSNEELAREVIQGKWGNGQARKDALTKAGYDYAAVQSIVNELCSK